MNRSFVLGFFNLENKANLKSVQLLAVTVHVSKIPQGLKCTSRIWKSVVIGKFWLVSADTREGGTCDEAMEGVTVRDPRSKVKQHSSHPFPQTRNTA